jgi:hypothetical protein
MATMAAREFEILKDHKVIYEWPDIFKQHLLKDNPKYQTDYQEKSCMGRSGVLMPCPHCLTNRYVSFSGFMG